MKLSNENRSGYKNGTWMELFFVTNGEICFGISVTDWFQHHFTKAHFVDWMFVTVSNIVPIVSKPNKFVKQTIFQYALNSWFNTDWSIKIDLFSGLCKETEQRVRPETEQPKSAAMKIVKAIYS